VKKSNYPVRTYSFTYLVYGTIPDEPWWHRTQFDLRYRWQSFPSSSHHVSTASYWRIDDRASHWRINSRTQRWRISDRQPSTVDIVVYELLICKLKESNSIA